MPTLAYEQRRAKECQPNEGKTSQFLDPKQGATENVAESNLQ